MKLENKKLVRVIAEQYARITELEEQLDIANSTISALASGKGLPSVKR
jgi:DNA-binding Xre family transcriptional regulator